MPGLVLKQSTRFSGGYLVAGTKLSILRVPGGWRVYSTVRDTDWLLRNKDLVGQTFPRLRDARETLEALVAADPFSSEMLHHPVAGTSLHRFRSGAYRVRHTENGEEYSGKLIKEHIVGVGWVWNLRTDTGDLLTVFRNLNAARENARNWLMSNAAGVSYHEWVLGPEGKISQEESGS